MTDPLQERMAEAVRGALKAQNGHVINDYRIYFGSSGTVDPEALSASLIDSLGLELEWWVYYDDHDGVRMDYDGPFAAAEEAQREADRAWPVLEVNGWTTPLYVKPRIVSGDALQVEESGK